MLQKITLHQKKREAENPYNHLLANKMNVAQT